MTKSRFRIVYANGDEPVLRRGDKVRIERLTPTGCCHVPQSLHGKTGIIAGVIEPARLDDEEEIYRHSGDSWRHHYGVAVPMTEIWPDYAGSRRDGLYLEICETCLRRI